MEGAVDLPVLWRVGQRLVPNQKESLGQPLHRRLQIGDALHLDGSGSAPLHSWPRYSSNILVVPIQSRRFAGRNPDPVIERLSRIDEGADDVVGMTKR